MINKIANMLYLKQSKNIRFLAAVVKIVDFGIK
jgi:hypothetical protein